MSSVLAWKLCLNEGPVGIAGIWLICLAWKESVLSSSVVSYEPYTWSHFIENLHFLLKLALLSRRPKHKSIGSAASLLCASKPLVLHDSSSQAEQSAIPKTFLLSIYHFRSFWNMCKAAATQIFPSQLWAASQAATKVRSPDWNVIIILFNLQK